MKDVGLIEEVKKVIPEERIVRATQRSVLFRSLYREDRHPSCSAFIARDGKTILVHDFATGDTWGLLDYVKGRPPIGQRRPAGFRSLYTIFAENPGPVIPYELDTTDKTPVREWPGVFKYVDQSRGYEHLYFPLRSPYEPNGPVMAYAVRIYDASLRYTSWRYEGQKGPAFFIPDHDPEKIKHLVIVEGMRNAAIMNNLLNWANPYKRYKRDEILVVGLHGASRHLRHISAIVKNLPNLKEVRAVIDNDTDLKVVYTLQEAVAPHFLKVNRFTNESHKKVYPWAEDSMDLANWNSFFKENRKPYHKTRRAAVRDYLSRLFSASQTMHVYDVYRKLFYTNALFPLPGLSRAELDLIIGIFRAFEPIKTGLSTIPRLTFKLNETVLELNTPLSRATIYRTLDGLVRRGLFKKVGPATYIIDTSDLARYFERPSQNGGDVFLEVNRLTIGTLSYLDTIVYLLRSMGVSYRELRDRYGVSNDYVRRVVKTPLLTDRSRLAPIGYTYIERAKKIVRERLDAWEELVERSRYDEVSRWIVQRWKRIRTNVHRWVRYLHQIIDVIENPSVDSPIVDSPVVDTLAASGLG